MPPSINDLNDKIRNAAARRNRAAAAADPVFNNLIHSALLRDMNIMLQIIDVRTIGEDGRRDGDGDDDGSGVDIGSFSSQRKTTVTTTTTTSSSTAASSAAAAEAGEVAAAPSCGLLPPPCWHHWYLGCVRFVARLLLGDTLSQLLVAEVERTLQYNNQHPTSSSSDPTTTSATTDASTPSVANIRTLLETLVKEREVQLVRNRDAAGRMVEGIVDPSSAIPSSEHHNSIQPYHHTPYLNAETVLLAQHKLSEVCGGSGSNPLSHRPTLMPVFSAADTICARIREVAVLTMPDGGAEVEMDSSEMTVVDACTTNWMERVRGMEHTEVGRILGEDDTTADSTTLLPPLATTSTVPSTPVEEHDTAVTTPPTVVPPPNCFTPVGALHDDPVLIDYIDNTLLEQWLHSHDGRVLFSKVRSAINNSTTTTTCTSDGGGGEGLMYLDDDDDISAILVRFWSGIFVEPAVLEGIIFSLKAALSSKTATQESSATAHLLAALERHTPTWMTELYSLCFIRRALGQLCFSRLMLRCRLTPHTVTAVGVHGYTPLTVSELIPPFLKSVCSKGALHVGSKALAKHIHRDQSEDWWCSQIYAAEDAARPPGAKKNPNKVRKGELVGSESTKNARSESVVAAVIGGAVWQNIHMLPHGHIAFELRQQGGYGARWCVMNNEATASTTPSTAPTPTLTTTTTTSATSTTIPTSVPTTPSLMFRGFLEPHAADGHAKGWTH